MPAFQISRKPFALDAETVANAVADVLPEPIQKHYVVVGGRRYPPKQVLTCATGLDRADFTTHHARRILKRLGFVAARVSQTQESEPAAGRGASRDGRQRAALAPHVGKWVALASPTEVLVAANTPQEVLAWLAAHERRAPYGMFRVPNDSHDAQGLAPL